VIDVIFEDRKSMLVSLTVVSALLLSAFAGSALMAKALHGKGSAGAPLDLWMRDTDGDGLINSLWANVTLDVTVQDVFTFDLTIRDQFNASDIAYATNSTYYLVGSHVIQMIVPGYLINVSGVDGPYVVSVQIQNDQNADVAYPSATTAAYVATDFEEPPATIGPSFGDYGVDLDMPADGLFNQLRLNLPVNVTEAGQYIYVAGLTGGMPPSVITMTFGAADLGPGLYDHEMSFSGLEISASGVDGPYTTMSILFLLTGSGPVMISQSLNNTGAYLAADFQTRATVPVAGTVTDALGGAVSGAGVIFANYTDLLQVTATTGPAGDYSTSLYPGEYTAIVDTGGSQGDYAENITVAGPGTIDFSLRAPSPGYNNVTVVMSDLNTMTVSTDGLMWDGVASLRMMVDWDFGNKDGVASDSELSLLFSVLGAATLFDDTDDIMYMDGIFYYPYDYAGNKYVIDVSGPIVSGPPASLSTINYLTSNATLPSAQTHTARLNVSLDQDLEKSKITILLPPGWGVMSATPDTNISYTGFGTDTFVIDPRLDTSGLGAYVWIDVLIGDLAIIPPIVEGQDATPNPAEYYSPVTISAWVNDSSPIASVDVEIMAPSGPPIGNWSMTLNAISGKYEFTLNSYPGLGTYPYTIWAVDTDSNTAFGAGDFVVQDTTAPLANAGPDQTVPNGTTVQFDGTASVDNYLLASWQWDFNDGTGPVVLTGSQPSHRFDITGVYTVTLTVTDTVLLTDTDTMTVTVTYPPKPNPPMNVTATQTTVTTVHVTWSAPIQNTDGSAITGPLRYLVFRADAPAGIYSQITPTSIDATQFDDTNLAPGDYYYKVEAVNQWGNHSEKSAYDQATVTDKGSVNGTVESEGQPLADVTVEILDSTGTVVDTATTAADGAFSFSDLSPGTYTIRASKDGYESKEKSVVINAFANKDAGIITLTKKSQATELPWMWIILIIAVTAIVVSLVAIMMKRRKKPAEQAIPQGAMPPPPPQMPMQQVPPQQAPPQPAQYPPPPPPPSPPGR
jgi:hypothetical protein